MADMLSRSGVLSPVVYGNRRLGLRTNTSSVKSVFPIRNRCKLGISSSSSKSGFYGLRISVDENRRFDRSSSAKRNPSITPFAQFQSGIIGRSHKWWEKGLQPNMKEITSAQDLVDSLLNAGDTLVVVDFFSPGCGGCKALHPKICQLAGLNPDVQFLHINCEEQRSMRDSLGVHVLPFFRFYKGAEGRVANFSCTNATIKKFKDALAKNSSRSTVGPTKGLEERELLALAANKDLSFTYTPKPTESDSESEHGAETVWSSSDNTELIRSPPAAPEVFKDSEEKSLVTAWR